MFELKSFVVTMLLLLILTGSAVRSETFRFDPVNLDSGGAFQYVLIDPSDRDVVYALSDVAGVFKSTDGGDSWSSIISGLDSDADLAGASLIIDPNNNQVLYLATGSNFNVSNGNWGALYRSDNGGMTWTNETSMVKFSGMGSIR